MKHSIYCLVLVMVTSPIANGDPGTVDLIILAGQSNMVGRAVPTATVPGIHPLDSTVKFHFDVLLADGSTGDNSGGTFGPLRPWRLNSSTENFGPEMSLGRILGAGQSNDVAIVKVAVGGTTIGAWQPGGGLFRQLSEAVHDTIQEIHAEGNDVNLLGLAWMQGESDDGISTELYGTRLNSLVEGFRRSLDLELPDLGFADLDVYLVEPADWNNGSQPGVALPPTPVDVALMEFAANDSRARFISTSDLNVYVDGIHLGPEDQTTLGERIAYAALGLPDSPSIVGGWRTIGRDSHWDDVNAALTGTAAQSFDANESFAASNAIDGDSSTLSRTSGDAAGHWWQVDLGRTAQLQQINIENFRRHILLTDGGGFRAQVLLADESVTWQQDFVGTQVDEVLQIPLPDSTSGQVVRLSKLDPVLEGAQGVFSLREVEVIANSTSFELGESTSWFFEIDANNDVADSLAIAGLLDVTNSNLVVDVINGDLAAGDSFDILEFQTISGEFANVGLPALTSNLAWDLSAIYVDGSISVIAQSLVGDYNDNGLIEQGDLDLVLLHWGADASDVPTGWVNGLPVETVDQAELDAVLLNWGAAASAIATNGVPEPDGVLLGLIAVTVVLIGRWRFSFADDGSEK